MPTPSTRPWPVLASDKQQKDILPILQALESALSNNYQNDYPALAGGAAGTSLFYGYLSLLPGKKDLAKLSLDILGNAVERVQEAHGSALFSGYSGIAWTAEHLQRQIYTQAGLPPEDGDGNEEVDEVLTDMFSSGPWESDYDLISGLAGYGVYALERSDKKSAKEVLEVLLKQLETLAQPQGTGLSWPTVPELLPPWQREIAPKGYYNLGLAHGVPGVLLLLAAMKKLGIAPKRSGKLLNGGVAWLLEQFQDPSVGNYLAGWHAVGQKKEEGESSRVAWCYGDLGASLALWQTGHLAGKPEWQEKALAMARLAARRPWEKTGVNDVGLCHGSAGNMVIFLRHYQNTGEAVFLDTAKHYLEHLIHTRTKDAPFAGYMSYHPDQDNPKENPHHSDPTLLEGAAGAGLALLAALGVEPRWDRFMMLSTAVG